MKQSTYTAEDIASGLQVNVETVRRWLRTGHLKGKKLLQRYIVTDNELQRFLGDDIYAGVIDTLPSLPSNEAQTPGKESDAWNEANVAGIRGAAAGKKLRMCIEDNPLTGKTAFHARIVDEDTRTTGGVSVDDGADGEPESGVASE